LDLTLIVVYNGPPGLATGLRQIKGFLFSLQLEKMLKIAIYIDT